MRHPAAIRLFAFAALLVLVSAAQGQQFTPEYFPFDWIYPAIQVDLNGDGIPDFIALDHQYQVDELLSSGGGNYTTQAFYISGGGGGYPVASGDFNGDGKADIVLFQPLGVAYGDGSGAFSSVSPISWSGSNHQFNVARAVVADFNGDGRPDIAIGFDTFDSNSPNSFQVVLFLNNGSGFHDGVTVYSQPVPSGSTPGFEYMHDIDLLLGDLDSDGHADLVFRTVESDPNNPANPINTITALFGDGKGGFTPVTVNSGNNLAQISAADLNNDGTTDIVAADFGPMTIYYAHPDRTFTTINISPNGLRNMNPMVADVNGDKRKDIVYAELKYPQVNNNIGVSTLLQSSSGNFRQQLFESIDTYVGYAGGIPFSQTFIGDYNHDGKPDVMLISTSENKHPNSADILLNNRPAANGRCQTPAPVGIHVCSPIPNQTVSNRVNFSFSAMSFYPVRKMEIWIDGKKVSETYEVFANEGFSDVKRTLPTGTHKVGLYSGGFDGTVQHTSYNITVK